MKALHLFSPLRKQPGFPVTSSGAVTIANVTYALILPAEISDEILVQFISAEDSYRQASQYCNAEGIEAVRARPTLLDDENLGLPAFAITLYEIENSVDDDAMNGCAAVRLVAGALAAKRLYNRACRRESLSADLSDYITSHDAYFARCGGFELLRIRHFFDADDKDSVMRDMETGEPPDAILKERGRTKSRFRDMCAVH